MLVCSMSFIGSVTPMTVLFDNAYFLGITIIGSPELAPRTQLNSVPYSFSSRAVSGDDNVFPAIGNVGIGTTSPSSVLHVSSNPGHDEWVTLIIDNTHDMGSINNAGHSTGSRVMFKGIIDANTQDEPQEIFTIGTDVESETGGTLAKNNFFIRDEYSSNNPVRFFISSDGNVGIGTTSPPASLTVGAENQFQVAGAEGDVTFTDDLASITFPATSAPNAPMIQMFASGLMNADRMVIAHSPPTRIGDCNIKTT